jgi:glycosyltransferase involved in cell wall biosynthesis
MKSISFILPSRDNLPYLKQAYNSIRKHLGYVHEVVMLDDFSSDGTWEWMQDIKKVDENCIVYRNDTGDRVGHTILYDKGVDLSSNEIFSIFHADMVATPGYVDNMIKHLEKGKVISSTRIEPPLHPPGPEKIIKSFGLGTEEFDDNEFQSFVEEHESINKDKTTNGIFAPWMMYKEDFEAIGGHDPLFAPMELEDSDIFNRFHLKGYELIQSRDSYCYHMTCRGSRFKDGLEIEKEIPLPDGTIWYKPKDSQEYLDLRANKFREWWRKWGTDVLHDDLMMPLIGKKFDIGFVIKNCNEQLLYHLEPWCSSIYVDCDINSYIEKEESQTLYDLTKKVFSINSEKNNDIIIRFDGNDISEEEFVYLTKLSTILGSDELEVGNFELGLFEVQVNDVKTYEQDNIKVEKDLNNYLEVK